MEVSHTSTPEVESRRMRVVVIGGGAIGLSCAYSLDRDGADVVVLERDRVGLGASRGNTGWLCPVLSAPLPAPGRDGHGSARNAAAGQEPGVDQAVLRAGVPAVVLGVLARVRTRALPPGSRRHARARDRLLRALRRAPSGRRRARAEPARDGRGRNERAGARRVRGDARGRASGRVPRIRSSVSPRGGHASSSRPSARRSSEPSTCRRSATCGPSR